MLNLLPKNVIEVLAIDDIKGGGKYQKQRALQTLETYEDENSRTTGMDKTILIKEETKIMLRRNIDITNGLVNGAIGIIKKCIKDSINVVTFIEIQFASGIHKLKRVISKFEIISKTYVFWKQFPISLAYAMTIHKS